METDHPLDPTQGSPLAPPQGSPLAPPSAVVTIPAQQLDKWFKLPSDQYLNIQITRSDLDRFYNVFDRIFAAQHSSHDVLIKWSNGDTAGAERDLESSRHALRESQNELRLFFMALMASATK